VTAVLSPPVDTSKLASATPGIYPFELTEGNYAGRMGVYVPPTYMPRVQQIPGARYSKGDQVWTLPKAYPAVLSLSAMAKETGLKILPHPALNEWVIEQAKHWNALRVAERRLHPGATKGEDDLFYPHQEDDGEWFAYGGGVEPMRARLLLSETGIGKTAGTHQRHAQAGPARRRAPGADRRAQEDAEDRVGGRPGGPSCPVPWSSPGAGHGDAAAQGHRSGWPTVRRTCWSSAGTR
jgi:hypothetical protein